MDDWVIVDTCVWASFFEKPGSAEKAAVDDLLDADRILLIGPIFAEVLLGFRRKDQADWVASRLRMAHDLVMTLEDWHMAADLGRDLIAVGNRVPLTDLVVAAAALRSKAWVYTTDPHFDLFPDLKRFGPK
jgi:predicted nucleic acid-binding protein